MTQALGSMSLDAVLDAFASTDPLPAGGSAASLAGALGAALLAKIGSLKGSALGTDAVPALRAARSQLLALADADSTAYAAVLDALRLPRLTSDEAEWRRARLAETLRAATEVPLAALRACRDSLRQSSAIAEIAPPSTVADVRVALELLRAATHGTSGSVDANLGSLRDRDLAEGIRAERLALEEDARRGLEAAQAILSRRFP